MMPSVAKDECRFDFFKRGRGSYGIFQSPLDRIRNAGRRVTVAIVKARGTCWVNKG